MRSAASNLVGGRSGEQFLRICQEAGYFLAERDGAKMDVIRLKTTLELGVKLAENIGRSWRANFNGLTFNENKESLVDLRGESFKEKFRLMKENGEVGRGAHEIVEQFEMFGNNNEDALPEGLLVVQPDKVQRMTRTLFSSQALRLENVLKVQRERKIWWMKVIS